MRTLTFLLTIVTIVAYGVFSNAQDNDLHDEIVQAFDTINTAFERDDSETIRSMATADHISITSFYDGAVTLDEQLAVDEYLNIVQRPEGAITVTSLAPDIAMQRHVAVRTGTFRGHPVPSPVAVTILWQRVDGEWRERLYQETQIDN